MKIRSPLALLVAVVGCGDGGDGGADAAPAFDARPIMRTDRVYVVSRMKLPRTEEEVTASSFEYPGVDYPVNKMGGLTSVLLDLVEPLSIQGFVDQGVTEGITLNAWIINSGPLDERDPAPTLTFTYLEDAEDPADPSNNLEVGAQLRVRAGTTPLLVSDDADLTDGTITGAGDVETVWGYELLLNDQEPPYLAPGIHGRQRLDITEDTIQGATSSVISPQQLYDDVYPGIALILTRAITEDVPMAATISGVYDTNGDGTVTTQELIENDTMASLTQPDVDLDGDGVKDHISQGTLVEGVRIELVE